jgi:hypothetical protein
MVVSVPLSAYAAVEDGNLKKITSDGQYEIGMSWQPAGPIEPGIDYLFNFEIREGMSQINIDDASFNFDIVKDGIVTDSTSSTTGTITKTISFDTPGLVNLMLTDVNSSTQQVDFTMPVGNETVTKDGISFAKKKYNAEPKIYLCGNSKDLKTCLDKQLDKANWFGKVTIMVYAPGWNEDSNKRDSIGNTADSALTVTSRGDGNQNFTVSYCDGSGTDANGVKRGSASTGLIETGEDTGVFYGRLKLSGMDHDINNDGSKDTGLGGTQCKNSPFDEYAKIETGRDGAFTVNWEYNPEANKTVTATLPYSWNIATISFLEEEYSMNSVVQFKFKDKDLGDMPKDKSEVTFRVWSSSDMSGITINASQNDNYKMKKPYFFNLQNHDESNGFNLYAQEGDTLFVEYVDTTLPQVGPNGERYSLTDTLDIVGTTSVGSGYPFIQLN